MSVAGLETIALTALGGGLLGIRKAMQDWGGITSKIDIEQKTVRQVGYSPFPEYFPADIPVGPVSKYVNADAQRCSIPVICTSDIDCQKLCGVKYLCQMVDNPNTILGGYKLDNGQKYCLPDGFASYGCRADTGIIILSYDQAAHRPTYDCQCKFPDVINGASCDQFLACRNPRNPSQIAPLIDATTGQPLPYNNLTGINLYETLLDGRPRYYCKCKSLDPLLTSGIIPFRCMRDPCLASMTGAPHSSVIGTPDGSRLGGELSCNCGDGFGVTRLLGGGTIPCKGFTDPRGIMIQNSEGKWVPKCIYSQDTFMPCQNAHNKRKDLPLCGTDGNYMVDTEAVEAGSCLNTCVSCAQIAKDAGRSTCGNQNMQPVCTGNFDAVTSFADFYAYRGSLYQNTYGCGCDVNDPLNIDSSAFCGTTSGWVGEKN